MKTNIKLTRHLMPSPRVRDRATKESPAKKAQPTTQNKHNQNTYANCAKLDVAKGAASYCPATRTAVTQYPASTPLIWYAESGSHATKMADELRATVTLMTGAATGADWFVRAVTFALAYVVPPCKKHEDYENVGP